MSFGKHYFEGIPYPTDKAENIKGNIKRTHRLPLSIKANIVTTKGTPILRQAFDVPLAPANPHKNPHNRIRNILIITLQKKSQLWVFDRCCNF